MTVDEIISFVSLQTLTPEALALAARVNSHMIECEDCLQKVRAFQAIYDELRRMGAGDLKQKMQNTVGESFLEDAPTDMDL